MALAVLIFNEGFGILREKKSQMTANFFKKAANNSDKEAFWTRSKSSVINHNFQTKFVLGLLEVFSKAKDPTPARTFLISGLKSRVLKLPFFT